MKKVILKFLFDLYHKTWPFLGAIIYRFPAYAKASAGKPSKKIKVIGVTGTNGKTTVVHMISEILEKAGYKVASISSLRFKIGEKEWKNMLKMTMPGRMKIQKFLRQAVDAGCQYCVIEITSEGIMQYRHKFIDFDVAVFTNLTPEHIERHGGFENYKKAKGEIFKIAKQAVINLDDENAEYFAGLCRGEKYGYSVNEKLKMKNERLQFKIKNLIEAKNISFKLNLLGEFNLYNALAAACVGLSQGVDIQIIKQTLEASKGIPGRMEVVVLEPFFVIVDYAHNPDALEKVYNTVKCQMSNVKCQILCVLGAAGGGRDEWKRPEMGKIAAQYCDQIILTDEDPYNEPPSQILSEIKSGISPATRDLAQRDNLCEILDRREAIKKALQSAGRGDIVIITGKGAEPWMMTKRGKVPWDDREIIKEEMKKLENY